MQVFIKRSHRPVELKIHTVSLSHSKSNEMLLFRCTNCGTAISQYLGNVSKIYPFVEPSLEVLKIDKCKECGALYTFQTVEYNTPSTKVILDLERPFSCFTCRAMLIARVGSYLELPIHMKCPTHDCSESYDFFDAV